MHRLLVELYLIFQKMDGNKLVLDIKHIG